jgi:crotonobetainyl-CoA:carnitine CoA-transferase CaiB-like acyl-CoA transferase
MPLSHLRVIDLTHYRAGPYCTRLLAGFGARVIKVERIGTGDPLRHSEPFVGGMAGTERSIAFHWLNAGKESCTLNLKSDRGRDVLLDLARSADVLVENFAPRVLPSLGLDFETLREVNPRLVMVSISNFGQDGPYRDFKADENVLYAMSGGMIATGDPDKPPLAPGPAITQYTAGVHAYIAILMSLLRAQAEASGEYIDVSIYESALENVEIHLAEYAHDGKTAKRNGDEHPLVPWRTYPCRDGYAAIIGGPPRHWPKAAKVLFSRSPLASPKFARAGDRIARRREVETLLRPWLERHGKREIYHKGQSVGLAFGYLATLEDVLDSPQHAVREFFVQTEPHPEVGQLKTCAAPFRSGGWHWRGGRAPLLGEHTRTVLTELGYSSGEIDRLAEEGVI